MKKKYITPRIKEHRLKKHHLLAGSITGEGKYNMGYGGVATNDDEYEPE